MKENKLIAEFMGLEYGDYITPHYHCNWNELMPVVQKIEDYLSDNIGVVGYFDECLSSNDLDTRYQAVVEFIKQLNKK